MPITQKREQPEATSEIVALSVHKPEIQVDPRLKLQVLEDVGKYWVLKMHYVSSYVQALKKVKGVFWNTTHKVYMVYRHPKVKEKVDIYMYEADERYSLIKFTESFKLIDTLRRMAYSKYSKPLNAYLLHATPKNL